jgi:hypothetical protein
MPECFQSRLRHRRVNQYGRIGMSGTKADVLYECRAAFANGINNALAAGKGGYFCFIL